MDIFFKRFFLILVLFLSFNIHTPSMENVDENNINHAKYIANNILERQLDSGINNIMRDHSKTKHSSGDSYFETDDREEMKELIKLVISDPDKFKFYTVKDRRTGILNYRLAISKKISEEDALHIFKKKNIGYDEKYSQERYRAVFCFGINNIRILSDSSTTGGFLTGFSAREDYILG
jgi:hypothetical protein